MTRTSLRVYLAWDEASAIEGSQGGPGPGAREVIFTLGGAGSIPGSGSLPPCVLPAPAVRHPQNRTPAPDCGCPPENILPRVGPARFRTADGALGEVPPHTPGLTSDASGRMGVT